MERTGRRKTLKQDGHGAGQVVQQDDRVLGLGIASAYKTPVPCLEAGKRTAAASSRGNPILTDILQFSRQFVG